MPAIASSSGVCSNGEVAAQAATASSFEEARIEQELRTWQDDMRAARSRRLAASSLSATAISNRERPAPQCLAIEQANCTRHKLAPPQERQLPRSLLTKSSGVPTEMETYRRELEEVAASRMTQRHGKSDQRAQQRTSKTNANVSRRDVEYFPAKSVLAQYLRRPADRETDPPRLHRPASATRPVTGSHSTPRAERRTLSQFSRTQQGSRKLTQQSPSRRVSLHSSSTLAAPGGFSFSKAAQQQQRSALPDTSRTPPSHSNLRPRSSPPHQSGHSAVAETSLFFQPTFKDAVRSASRSPTLHLRHRSNSADTPAKSKSATRSPAGSRLQPSLLYGRSSGLHSSSLHDGGSIGQWRREDPSVFPWRTGNREWANGNSRGWRSLPREWPKQQESPGEWRRRDVEVSPPTPSPKRPLNFQDSPFSKFSVPERQRSAGQPGPLASGTATALSNSNLKAPFNRPDLFQGFLAANS